MRPTLNPKFIVFITAVIGFTVAGLIWTASSAAKQDTTRVAAQDTARAQGASQDTTRPAATVVPVQQGQELVLEEIYIEPVVEKPSVSIVPRRQEPDFEEVELVKRSFADELKSAPNKIMMLDEELESAKRVRRIKKILAKNKK